MFSVHIKLQIFLSPLWIQEALLGIRWGRGPEDWIMDHLLLAPGWSSAGKMSTALTIIMHFTVRLTQKARRNIPQMSRASRTSWMKRVCWPHNRVHPTTDSTEGTVEIFSLNSFKNDYCSMFRASSLRKQTEILSNVLLFHVFKLKLYQLVLL